MAMTKAHRYKADEVLSDSYNENTNGVNITATAGGAIIGQVKITDGANIALIRELLFS